MSKMKFTIEFAVDESWVADGFNPDNEDALTMLSRRLPYAFGHELRAKVVKKIDQRKAAKLQGYASVKAMGSAK